MRILAVALILLSAMRVEAQTTDTVQLTFKDALRLGLKNNLELNQQKNNLFSRQVQKNQRIASFLPVVVANGSASHTDGLQPAPDGADLQDLSIDNVQANLYAEMTIFNGLNNINSLRQAVNQFRAQTSLVERTEQDLIYNVATQYLQVMLDQELLRIAEENYRAQDVLLDQLREQVKLGARAESELYNQDAQVKNMKLLVLRAKVTLENDKALLSQTLQMDPAVPFKVDLPTITSSSGLENLSLDSLYDMALENRQDLKQARYQMQANQDLYRSALNGYTPSVSIFFAYGSQYNSALRPQPLFGDFSNQFTRVWPSTQYGINVRIPIFDRLQTRSLRVANKVQYENSELQVQNLEKRVKIDVLRSYNNYQTSIEAYNASQTQFEAGQLALLTQQESFVLGVSNQVTLAQANQTYVQAASSRAQAQVTLLFQQILLEYALGTLNVDNLVRD